MAIIFCPSCKENKDELLFANNKARPNGKSGYCKVCMRALVVKWKKENPSMLSEQQKRALQRRREQQEYA